MLRNETTTCYEFSRSVWVYPRARIPGVSFAAGGDGGAGDTRRRSEIANGPSRESDGGARGNNGDATDDANRGTGDGGDGDGEGDSDVEVDATVSRAPPKRRPTAMEVTEWRANGTIRKTG